MTKVIYLTGAPASGKSSTTRMLAERVPGLGLVAHVVEQFALIAQRGLEPVEHVVDGLGQPGQGLLEPVVLPSVTGIRPGHALGRRVDGRHLGHEPLLTPGAALRVGEAETRDAVRPGQGGVGGHVVEAAPAHQEGLREDVVGRRRIGTTHQEPPQRLDQLGREGLEPGSAFVGHRPTVSHPGDQEAGAP